MPKKKQILFVHQNFPGQFKFLAPALIKEGYDIHALGNEDSISQIKDKLGVTMHSYKILQGSTTGIEVMAVEFETKMLRARFSADKAEEMKSNGLYPSLIVAHPQWGESFFLKDIWPKSQILSYFEFHWHVTNSDVDFDDEFMDDDLYRFIVRKLRARNVYNYAVYGESDAIICPTNYQKNTAPSYIKERINVIHDGIDTKVAKPNPKVEVTLDNKILLTKKDKVVTFVSRNLEPYRGYHIFMRSLPGIMEKNPDAVILIIGGDAKGYGSEPPKGKTWKEIFLDEVKEKVDTSKIYFLGMVDYEALIRVFQLTSVHVYLSYPFVLSWSMLEAMSCEAVVVGSDTDPVKEVIKNNKNGITFDFFDTKALANTVNKILKNPKKYKNIASEARNTIIKNYDIENVCLPKQIKLVKKIIG